MPPGPGLPLGKDRNVYRFDSVSPACSLWAKCLGLGCRRTGALEFRTGTGVGRADTACLLALVLTDRRLCKKLLRNNHRPKINKRLWPSRKRLVAWVSARVHDRPELGLGSLFWKDVLSQAVQRSQRTLSHSFLPSLTLRLRIQGPRLISGLEFSPLAQEHGPPVCLAVN